MTKPIDHEYTFEIDPSDTVESVKPKIKDRTGFPSDKYKLIENKPGETRPWHKCEIEDGRTLSEYEIKDESRIFMIFIDGRRVLDLDPHNQDHWAWVKKDGDTAGNHAI
jgi:hypothetical protein